MKPQARPEGWPRAQRKSSEHGQRVDVEARAYGDGKGSAESVWQHARTFLRVESVVTRDGVNTRREARLSRA